MGWLRLAMESFSFFLWSIFMINLVVTVESGDLDFALRRLKSKMQSQGIASALKRSAHFVPRGERRRDKSLRARVRRKAGRYA
jgi:ribosomal protein S21